MRVYIIEYRRFFDGRSGDWQVKISQEGYRSLEEAQAFIESRQNNPAKITNTYYQAELLEEYYIHEILITGGDKE